MYSKDVRTRSLTFDRMRADQEKLNTLTNKMRQMKQRLKSGAVSTPDATSPQNKRARSLSPSKPMPHFDLIDASAFGSTAMREILNAHNNSVQESPAILFDGDTNRINSFTPSSTFRSSYNGSFTPNRSSSPMTTGKKSKLSISTSTARLNSNMSQTTGGIAALHSSRSPQRFNHTTSSHMSSTGNLSFPRMSANIASLNQALPPSTFQSSISNLGDYFNTPSSNIQPNEAKSLYFAHYNGLEVQIKYHLYIYIYIYILFNLLLCYAFFFDIIT